VAENNFRLITEIEVELRDLIPNFLKNRAADLRQARELTHKQDFGPLKNLAHAIRGACMSFGFHAAAKVAAAIEKSAMEQNVSATLKNIERLQAALEHIEICYV